MKFLQNGRVVCLATICLMLAGCGFATGQLHDKAMEEQHLKPGALDKPITTSATYPNYSYKLVGKYRISHDWYGLDGCHYHGPQVGMQGDIYEQDGHTFQAGVLDTKPQNIDRYVRPEWQMGPDRDGDYRSVKGFEPVCFESWGRTSHVLAIKLYKKSISTWRDDLAKTNPNGKLSEENIGGNTWLVQTNEIAERRINSTGGAFLNYTTAIGNTGYTLTVQLGANQDSLKYPQAHAQIQAIFRHLVESVKIEPISTDAK